MAVIGAFCVSVNKEICVNAQMPGKCATCAEVCPHSVYALDRIHRRDDGTELQRLRGLPHLC